MRQIQLVEFSEKIYHLGLRHTGLNGSLYEDILIKFLREDIPELDFYKGQIRSDQSSSPQYDIIICKKGVSQSEFLKEVNPYINLVDVKDCLGVIELKKWSYPKMIKGEKIKNAYNHFKSEYPQLKYYFVAFRFRDRQKKIENTWHNLNNELSVDEKFCFFGNVRHRDKEWEIPWKSDIIQKHKAYDGEYERLLDVIINLSS